MSINEYIAKQFANPRGIGGRIVMAVMNRQNAQMYEETEGSFALETTTSYLT